MSYGWTSNAKGKELKTVPSAIKDGTAFAQAWLAAAVHTDAAYRAFAEASWLPGGPRLVAATG